MRGSGQPLQAVDVSRTCTLATGDMAGAVRFYDAVRHRQLGRAYATCRLCSIVEVQFSPDGTRLAVAGTNGAAAGTNGTPLPEGNGLLHLLDVRRRTRIAALDTRAGITELPLYPSETLAFTADSRTLTAASPEQDGAQYHALGCPQRAGARSPTAPLLEARRAVHRRAQTVRQPRDIELT